VDEGFEIFSVISDDTHHRPAIAPFSEETGITRAKHLEQCDACQRGESHPYPNPLSDRKDESSTDLSSERLANQQDAASFVVIDSAEDVVCRASFAVGGTSAFFLQ
jgi:hypothetical protein